VPARLWRDVCGRRRQDRLRRRPAPAGLANRPYHTLKRQQIILPTINTLGQTFIIKNLPPNNVLRIYDGLGKLIYYEQNYTNNKQLVLSNAVYFICLEYKNDNNEQEVLVGKLLGME
jgi:hypothetical protein